MASIQTSAIYIPNTASPEFRRLITPATWQCSFTVLTSHLQIISLEKIQLLIVTIRDLEKELKIFTKSAQESFFQVGFRFEESE